MISVHYQKRKNTELFQQFEDPNLLFLSSPQNYIPIYKRFFSLNDSNYNHINLNNKWFISSIHEKLEDDCAHIYSCRLKNIETNKVKDRDVFFKLAPLLDPYKFMVGKYDVKNPTLFVLPKIQSTTDTCQSKYLDVNNAAYVDSFFLFLSSQLKHQQKFVHGIDYYGSYLGIKNNYRINVADDIEYLITSNYFNEYKNKLFYIDDHEYLFQSEKAKPPLVIGHDISLKSCLSMNNDIFDGVFEENTEVTPIQTIDLNDLKDMSMELIDVTKTSHQNDQQVTLMSSGSTCSSRSSYTNDDDISEDVDNCEHCGEDTFESGSEKYSGESLDGDASEYYNEDEEEDDDDDDEDDLDEEPIYVTIPQFPVQIIGMECCESTLDELIVNDKLQSDDEYFSAFMQIIMTLITYQKAFYFTHNDLHTNNVMYDTTDKKYLYYCYKKTYYKVPTFGRIFKIIDFGRSIYKFDGKIFCSDSFQAGGDAATQYNTEPYFNDKKPRLEPNFSFDLCRLACSMYDFAVTDEDNLTPVSKLIRDWCLDDKGFNMLYKANGVERYPDFKLYKMIARCVHHHTPQAQLERPEFAKYKVSAKQIKNLNDVINLDNIPCYA